MAIPTRTVTVALTPTDGKYVEDWSSPFVEWDKWFVHQGLEASFAVTQMSDGPMGDFIRVGDLSRTDGITAGALYSARFWNQRLPFAVRSKIRCVGTGNLFNAVGIPYNGEPGYQGIAIDMMQSHLYADGFNREASGFTNLVYGAIYNFDYEYALSTYQRYRVNGGLWGMIPAGSANAAIYGAISGEEAGAWPTYDGRAQPEMLWPYTLMFESWGTTGNQMDVGRVEVTSGTPMWGCCDALGWDTWNLSSNCVSLEYWESSRKLGGLTAATAGGNPDTRTPRGYRMSGHTAGSFGASLTQAFSGVSPIVVPEAGWAYAELQFQVYNAAGGNITLRVMDADTGTAYSTGVIPGNADLVAHATAIGEGVPHTSPTTQYVSLAGVPAGKRIYLELVGATLSTQNIITQPRLGGVWVSFQPASYAVLPAAFTYMSEGVLVGGAPALVGVGAFTAKKKAAQQTAVRTTDYGTDVSTTHGLDPTFTLIGERRAIAEVYARMLQTPRGSLFYAPSRGTDVRAWLNARVKDAGTLARWRHEIEAEGERDERIESATATLTWDQKTGELRIAVAVQSAAGPFNMVLAVTALTLNILEVQ